MISYVVRQYISLSAGGWNSRSDLDIHSKESVEDMDVGGLEVDEESEFFQRSALGMQNIHAFPSVSQVLR